ncbi:flagellin [Rhodobacteraceae bacterium D3-12]|nr:flagellin [Rhodobacteraceae bacterium D3-12]
MPLYSIGDMASSFMLRRQNVSMNAELAKLTEEMASGQAADVSKHLNGNYSYLGDVERNLRLLEGFDTAAKEASSFTSAMQSALEKVQQTTTTLSSDLILAGNTNLPQGMEAASNNARGELSAILSALNTNVAGRALFSGASTDTATFASADDFLSHLRTEISGLTSLHDIKTAIDAWFDTSGGGFETDGYLGATTDLSPFLVGEGETVTLALRGDTQVIRDLLKSTAMAALAADPALGYSTNLQSAMIVSAGESLITSQSELVGVRADLGYAEARIEESKTRVSAEKTSFEISRNELLGVDLYDTATRLKAVQFQLESLYTATARLSGLSLVEYLR